MRLWLDLETYSETPISCGTYRYAEDAEIILFAYAIDDEPAQVTESTSCIQNLLDTAAEIWAHNSMFDRTVQRYNGFDSDVTKWRDTQIQAYAHGLPGSLDELGRFLGLREDQQKLKHERKLIRLFCKPQPKNHKIRRATRNTHPEEWARFKEYARMDVEAMRFCQKKMPNVNYPRGAELRAWHLDQLINDRGFNVDRQLVDGAIAATIGEQANLSNEVTELTDGEVTRASQRDNMLRHIMEQYGYPLPDLKKDTIERRLNDDNVPAEVKELLRIRLQAASSSTSKYKSLQRATNDDGRCRGTIQFYGAKRTGRAAGRTFQPQNLPSRGLLGDRETEFGIRLIRDGVTPSKILYPNLMKLLVSSVRGCLSAPKGKKLVIADLANIEGRFAAWVCGEDWKLKAFTEYDDGTGPDLYKLAYANSFRCTPDEVTKDQRQIGKVMELMLQYQGGVGAFLTGAETYGFDVNELADGIYPVLPSDQVKKAQEFLQWRTENKLPSYGLRPKSFIACDVLKRLWRNAHPRISSMWRLIEDKVAEAMDSDRAVKCGERLRMLKKGNYFYIRLPSGRCLVYPAPKYNKEGKFTFLGDNPYSRKYQRLSTYGGKLLENIVQAGSRDILYAAKPEAEKRGYKIVLHVHDELITETPDSSDFSVNELSQIMIGPFHWADGLPLAAAGFETCRYKKG